MADLRISGNRFGHGSEANRCPIRLPAASAHAVGINVWDADGTPVRPNIY